MKFKENFYGNEREIQDGFYEHNLVGGVDVERLGYEQEIKKLQEKAKQSGWKISGERYLPFPYAIELAKRFQNGNDPINPQKDFAREFRLAMAERLGLIEEKELNRLKFFTCAGGEKSPADFFHGLDFFVSFKDEQGKEIIFPGDVTKDAQKSQKADFLVGGDIPDPGQENFNEKEYLELIDHYSQEAVAILEKKMKEHKFWQTDMTRPPRKDPQTNSPEVKL
jgi:hypothetical protein